MARPKGKTAAKNAPVKNKATQADGAEMSVKPQATKRAPRKFAFRNYIHPQTSMLMFGVTLPLALVWIGSWLIFTLPKLLEQIKQYVQSINTAAPAVYENALLPLYGSNGVAYIVLGVIAYILAVVIFWFVFRRLRVNELALGELRVRSIAITLIVFFIITAIIVSLANKVLFDSLLALSSGV
jgi:hypothetical protein